MWRELDLDDRSAPAHPFPLAHERLASMIRGLSELCLTVAGQVRRRPGFKDASTILTADEIRTNLEIERFVRGRCEHAGPENPHADSGAEGTAQMFARVRLLANFELHRRKIFWVDESLAYMLAKTDLDVTAAEVRVPFPSFALVFMDRHTLSLAERTLSFNGVSPLAGHFLRVATVYITEECREDDRVMSVAFALDALGADTPDLVTQEIPLAGNRLISEILDDLSRRHK
jgi:hypothetical protein